MSGFHMYCGNARLLSQARITRDNTMLL